MYTVRGATGLLKDELGSLNPTALSEFQQKAQNLLFLCRRSKKYASKQPKTLSNRQNFFD